MKSNIIKLKSNINELFFFREKHVLNSFDDFYCNFYFLNFYKLIVSLKNMAGAGTSFFSRILTIKAQTLFKV